MSSQTMTEGSDALTSPVAPRDGARVTQARVVRGEWIKLRSLRSTYVTVGVALLGMVALGWIFAAATGSHDAAGGPVGPAHFDPTTTLEGVEFAQLALAVLGVMVVTSEYHAGLIRATLAAVPTRLPVFWAKAGVVTAVAVVTGLVGGVIAFFGSQAIVSGDGIHMSIGDPGMVRDVIGLGLYLGVVALLSVGIGWTIRSTGGAMATALGILLVVPIIGELLPVSWANASERFLPTNAGLSIIGVRAAPYALGPWTGFGVFCLYAILALAVGLYTLRRRDA